MAAGFVINMRFLVIIGLFLSFVVLARGALQSWEKIEIPTMPVVGEKKKAGPVVERQSLALNPRVPDLLPDLKQGYLFNEERQLSENTGEEESVAENAPEATSTLVNMETLTYVGSIIIGDVRKGLVSFSVAEPKTSNTPGPRVRPVSRVSREAQKYASLKEQEPFYDFRVARILPEKIVFAKGDSTVEKLLYDPEKERVSSPMPVRRGGPIPVQGTAVPQPVRSAQTIPQPEATQPNDANINQPTASRSNPSIRPTLPNRPIRRPQVIQRRRLPTQSP